MNKKKTILITGATSGIGKATLLKLANSPDRYIFIARNKEKAEQTKLEVIEQCKNKDVDFYLADLSRMEEVKKVADEISAKESRIDTLINNAGILGPDEKQLTDEGFELTFATNHLSMFLLSNLLLPLLEKSNTARVINVSSEAHRITSFNLNNLQGEEGYSSLRAYSLSKMCNILFTIEAAKRWQDKGIKVNCMHPGGVNTNFGEGKGFIRNLAFILAKPFFISPEKGAETIIYLAQNDIGLKVNGKYLKKKKIIEPSKSAKDVENALKLWNLSTALVKSHL
ncbi:SDR family NAD(P)-dependent oxidoreductase [Peijinzhouia sedimentorum]